LASERKEIASMVKKGEKVLVMFGGVAPYAIVIGKNSKAEKIVSVELGRECNKYVVMNVKRNKLDEKVEIVQGDVRKIIGRGKKVNLMFDRIVMARPNLRDSFLDVAFSVIKKNGIIHYYGFYDEDKIGKMKEMIANEAKMAGKRIKILRVKKAGDIGVRKFRYRVDLRVY
jgi:tRNA (guanine37-N1)-methyltransferase